VDGAALPVPDSSLQSQSVVLITLRPQSTMEHGFGVDCGRRETARSSAALLCLVPVVLPAISRFRISGPGELALRHVVFATRAVCCRWPAEPMQIDAGLQSKGAFRRTRREMMLVEGLGGKWTRERHCRRAMPGSLPLFYQDNSRVSSQTRLVLLPQLTYPRFRQPAQQEMGDVRVTNKSQSCHPNTSLLLRRYHVKARLASNKKKKGCPACS